MSQFIGWGYGGALAMMVLGDKIKEKDNYKISVGAGAVGSIGMGLLGRSLGKRMDWSEGQASMYTLWGSVGPAVTSLAFLSFNENMSVQAGSFLLGGAAGYLAAGQFNKADAFSRGEVRGAATLAVMNGSLGSFLYLDILMDDKVEPGDWGWLFPAAGMLGGTLLGQSWLKNTELTPRQGMNAIWMASGGAFIGLGVALIVNAENLTPWYAIPYATSLGAFAYSVESARKKNASGMSATNGSHNKWNFSLMPQNLFLNEMINKNGNQLNGRKRLMQPMFSASVLF